MATTATRNSSSSKTQQAKGKQAKGKPKAKQVKSPVPSPAHMQWHGEQCNPKADRDGNRVGVTTGLVLTHYVNELLAANYEAELTDTALNAILRQEYPNRAVIQSIAAYRSYFNAGLHGFGHGVKLEGEERLPRWGK